MFQELLVITKTHNSVKYVRGVADLVSAHRLIMLYLCTKFHENMLNIFLELWSGHECFVADSQTDRETDRQTTMTIWLPWIVCVRDGVRGGDIILIRLVPNLNSYEILHYVHT